MISETDLIQKPDIKQIFKQYFRRKLFFWWALFLITTIGRYYNTHRRLEWSLTAAMLAGMTLLALFLGFLDFYFYEKTSPKIRLKLINTSPLKEFFNVGFVQEDDGEQKLTGNINGFNVVLSPLINQERKKFLVILIPIVAREGLEDCFSRFDDLFRLTLSGEVIMATATINDYDKTYDFESLLTLLKNTTNLLLERNIQPLEVIDD